MNSRLGVMDVDYEAIAVALPGYEVGEELGRGGSGIVLAGRHRQLDRRVAITQLSPVFAGSADRTAPLRH